ncbi:GNAT family N-acetyltransferase [bacterium]|nr:GNAT family N-acetyltransferase [bacterium]
MKTCDHSPVKITLTTPNPSFKASFLAGLEEMQNDSDQSAWVYLGDSSPRDIPYKDFESYVQTLLKRENEAPVGFVKDTTYWAILGDEMVGRISIRHHLNDFLKKIGGHIGYIVRPSFRQKGIATEILRQALQSSKAQSIGKLLLTCDEENIASEKSIVKNGGIFESTVYVGENRPRKKHFWISLNS